MGQLFHFESPLSARHKQTNHPESNRSHQSRCGYGQNPIVCSGLLPVTFRRLRTSNASLRGLALLPSMIMNSTNDPLNPFNGGEVKLSACSGGETVLSQGIVARVASRAMGNHWAGVKLSSYRFLSK